MSASTSANKSASRFELDGFAALAAVGSLIAVLFAGSTLLTPLYVMYKDAFGFSKIQLTLIYSVYVVGNLTALLAFGRLSDTIGRRRTALPALGIGVVSAVLFLVASNVAMLYVARALSGLAIGDGAGTGTAWLAELIGKEERARATIIVTAMNFLGLGIGSLMTGLLVQYLPWPLHLTFVCYIGILLVIAAAILFTRETVEARPFEPAILKPHIALPKEVRAQFFAPAITIFGAMSLVGFYAALAPSILIEELHKTSHLWAGALFFELAMAGVIGIVATGALSSGAAMLTGLALMVPSVVVLVAAQLMGSTALMLVATALCGLAGAIGYRGSLEVVNKIAPDDKRSAIVSAYLLCGFTGNAIPVIGIGILTVVWNSSVASLAFAAMMIVFSAAAFVNGSRHRG